jgi:D-glycerate 3-kinase
MLDMLILLAAPSFDVVFGWRLEQEQQLRREVQCAAGDLSRLMDEAQLRHFVAHYERLTRHILEEMPHRADIVVPLDAQRRATQWLTPHLS